MIGRPGGTLVEIDFAPFQEAARLLYEGPWIAERYVAIREFIARQPESLHPITRLIIEGGSQPSAADAFSGYYQLMALRRVTDTAWQAIDISSLRPPVGSILSPKC
jgi:allophanate hydrolase